MAMEWSDTDHDVTNYGEEGDDSSNYGNEGSSHVFPAMVLQLQLLVTWVLQTQLWLVDWTGARVGGVAYVDGQADLV